MTTEVTLFSDIIKTFVEIAINSGLFLLLFLIIRQLREELLYISRNIPVIATLIFGLLAVTSISIITNIFLYFWVMDMEILILG